MLSSYRATPHPSTGIAPGNIMFRAGYKKDFPRIHVDEETIKAAIGADIEERERKGREANASNHRVQTQLLPNQLVYIRNNRRNKFDPIFGPEVHKVVDVKGNGTILLRLSDSKIVRRHLDDVKDATAVINSTTDQTCWINSNPTAPQSEPTDAPTSEPTPPMTPPSPPAPTPQVAAEAPQEAARNNGRPQRNRKLPKYLRDECWVME